MEAVEESMDAAPNAALTLAGLNINAIGSIGPDALIESGIATHEDIDALCTTAVTNNRIWKATPHSDIKDCYDGRPPEDPSVVVDAPKAAGGTETIVVGQALIGGREPNETCSAQTARVAGALVQQGHGVGGHTAEVHGDAAVECGCGACDKLQKGLDFIANSDNTPALRTVLDALGVRVDDATIAEITANAGQLASSGYADGGRNIVDAIKRVGGETCAPKLGGKHLEGAVVINRVYGETLDRTALAEVLKESGLPNMQLFGLDLWAIREAARNFASSPDRMEAYVAAMVMHNIAIAAVLCGPSLRVVVR